MHRSNRQKRGFTLIELLVVISIIALLLSILMPSLNKAKWQARKTICQSNHKQLSLGLYMYASANRDYFPQGYDAKDGTFSRGQSGRMQAYEFDPVQRKARYITYGLGYLYFDVPKYLTDADIFMCPGTPIANIKDGTYGVPCRDTAGVDKKISVASYNYYNAYPFVYQPDGPNSNYYLNPKYSRKKTTDRGRNVLVSDIAPLGYGADRIWGGTYCPTHKTGASTLYVDGHVRWIDRKMLSDYSYFGLDE